MQSSKVYFTTFKTNENENLLQKLHRLMKTAGFEKIDFTDKYTAIKLHFGEYGNLAFLRPNYAKVVADYVKELGGRPFLTDCNTLYVGSRKNALDHLETAYVNGFSPLQTGCHVIIADGLKGTDETLVPIDGEYVREAKIGHAIMDADVFISLSHFKGHEMAGFGGAIKNIGMGCGSRAGKMEQHCEGKPSVDQSGCIGCGACRRICAHGAPVIENGKAMIDHDKCVGCGRCLAVCPKDVIAADFADSVAVLNYKMAEYSLAVCKDRPCFHISLICDVSPNCDCHSENDIPIIADIGMLASFDPVALDQACADLCNQAEPIKESELGEQLAKHMAHKAKGNGEGKYTGKHGNGQRTAQGEGEVHEEHDHFHMVHPDTEWRSCIVHAVKIGLGTDKYELVQV
ncbi:MAG: DUF362 domain-containing protein [Lachnospiraceae bacterium]|nr:DUF362 domain-containing protein [Lachnospiraceae bacterium]